MRVHALIEHVTGDPSVAEIGVLRFRGDARYRVETVDGTSPPLSRAAKWIINVSTQFGCPVGCPLCDAGWSYYGNLSADEILSQVEWALGRHPGLARRCAKLKVHFSRIGEPALNDAVLDAIERLPDVVESDGLWCCVATTAPHGREQWLETLLEIKQRLFRGRFQLQFSMQTTDEEARDRLIPIRRMSDQEICDYGRRFFTCGDRRVVLNYALAFGVPFDPGQIISTFDPAAFAVKITPVNPTARGAAAGLRSLLNDTRNIEPVLVTLRNAGFDVIVSIGDRREDAIRSNCGQVVAAV